MLDIGQIAPDFDVECEKSGATSLYEMLQSGAVIVYFYPADFTPGCTKEACSIRDMHKDIQAAGLRVIGISPQDAASHAKFRAQYDLPFALVSDPEKALIRAYDVDGPFGVGVRRATFVVGKDQRILDALMADVRVRRHSAFIENAISPGA